MAQGVVDGTCTMLYVCTKRNELGSNHAKTIQMSFWCMLFVLIKCSGVVSRRDHTSLNTADR